MRWKQTLVLIVTLAGLWSLYSTAALAQWGYAQLDSVAIGLWNESMGRNSLGIDAQGDLHLVYDRFSGGVHQFYYKTKSNGGTWSWAMPIGYSGGTLQSPYLAVRSSNGYVYLVYLWNSSLRLTVGTSGIFNNYDLLTPGTSALFSPAVAVDSSGIAHIALVAELPTGEYKIGYGYWQNNSFHFQILENSQLGDFGSGASPDICAISTGGVAISYRGGNYLGYQIHTAENFILGGTAWEIQHIYNPDYQCYESSIRSAPNNSLYLAYSGDMGWGFPGRVFATMKPAGAYDWGPSYLTTGTFSAVAPKLAVMPGNIVHIAFMERSGNILTGNIGYTNNLSGSWTPQYLLQGGNKYYPSLVMDAVGNGSLAFQQEVTYQDNDVYYYGYVAPVGPLPGVSVTLTPVNPPIVIPPGGGSFDFNITLTNNDPIPRTFGAWVMVQLPNGQWFGPVMQVAGITLPGGATISRIRTQMVPPGAPPGLYSYIAYVGVYPGVVYDSSYFNFTKMGNDGGETGFDTWSNTGEPFDLIGMASSTTDAARLIGSLVAAPNPFNPTTVLSFELRASSFVSLKVYNTTGRQVAILMDGWQEVGEHRVTFDGLGLPSGVYLYRLQVGEQMASGKVVLLK